MLTTGKSRWRVFRVHHHHILATFIHFKIKIFSKVPRIPSMAPAQVAIFHSVSIDKATCHVPPSIPRCPGGRVSQFPDLSPDSASRLPEGRSLSTVAPAARMDRQTGGRGAGKYLVDE